MFKQEVIPWLIEPGNDFVRRLDAFVENVLFPESLINTDNPLPESHLKHLIDVGLVSVVTSADTLWNTKTKFAITEQIAFGCLDTWFVITQHWGAANIIQRSSESLNDFWDMRSLVGVGFGHLRRKTPCLCAEHCGTGIMVAGNAPWVTGSNWLSWVVYGATLPSGDHVYFRLSHREADGYSIGHSQALAAVRRTDTREVLLNLTVTSEFVICERPREELARQDEATLVTSMAPILGLTARCLFDWSMEIMPENHATFEQLRLAFERLRQKVYGMISDITAISVAERLCVREELHRLLETVIHIWSLTSGGQSNTLGMMVIRRRQEAAFFRVFQQTKSLRDAALATALSHIGV